METANQDSPGWPSDTMLFQVQLFHGFYLQPLLYAIGWFSCMTVCYKFSLILPFYYISVINNRTFVLFQKYNRCLLFRKYLVAFKRVFRSILISTGFENLDGFVVLDLSFIYMQQFRFTKRKHNMFVWEAVRLFNFNLSNQFRAVFQLFDSCKTLMNISAYIYRSSRLPLITSPFA